MPRAVPAAPGPPYGRSYWIRKKVSNIPYRTWATNDVPSAADFNALHADPVSQDVATDELTTSATYTDLTTAGPAVSIAMVNGQTALVIVSMQVTSAAVNTTYGAMSFAASGAMTVAAADANAAIMSMAVGEQRGVERTTKVTATSTATATFTAKYRSQTGGTAAHFVNRRIIAKTF